jgi:hypothetical protein
MKITGEFIRNMIAAIALTGTAVGAFVSIKTDIAQLQVQLAYVAIDLTDLKREVRNNVAETVFKAGSR